MMTPDQNEVSDAGRLLWRQLTGTDGWSWQLRAQIASLTDEDIKLLQAELRTILWNVLGPEAERRTKK